MCVWWPETSLARFFWPKQQRNIPVTSRKTRRNSEGYYFDVTFVRARWRNKDSRFLLPMSNDTLRFSSRDADGPLGSTKNDYTQIV